MTPLYPDKVTSFVLSQLAYEGTDGVPFQRLWELIPGDSELTPLYKSIVYSWIKDNKNIELVSDSRILKELPPSLESVPEDALIKVTEDYQWILLTSSPKENNPIGNAAFQLLVEIAKNRETGIDSLTLTKNTGQDNRSLTQRIKALSHLIKKLTILKKGRTLSLFILNKFYNEDSLKEFDITNGSSSDVTINLIELREKIMNMLKNAKSGIRQMNDLRRELEMDKSSKLKVIFKSVVTYLELRGYLSKLLVVSSVSQAKKIRSLKFLKDYTRNDSTEDDDEEDAEDFFNNDLVAEDLKDLDDDDEENNASVINNTANHTQFMEASPSNIHTPSLNRFYPFQNQLYETINANGNSGCSSNFLIEEFFGTEYSRLFNKWIESYTSGKLLPHISDLGIIRHYDFNGRVKFYRYITRPNLLQLTHKPADANGFSLCDYKSKGAKSLEQLNKANQATLGTRLETYIDADGVERILWRGEGGATQSLNMVKTEKDDRFIDLEQPVRKRGRPKKGEERPKAAKKSKKSKEAEAIESVVPDDEVEQLKEIINHATAQEPVMKTELVEQELIISDIRGTSFKAIERQAAILRLLEDSDGVRENNFVFLTDLREELGYIIDKKTFHKDVNSLVSQGRVIVEDLIIQEETGGQAEEFLDVEETKTAKVTSLLISVNATIDAIENLKRMLRQTQVKKTPSFKKLEEVNLEIDFFDTELRESFNNPKIPVVKEEVSKPKIPREPKAKKPRQIKPRERKIQKPKRESRERYTARIEASEEFDPNVSNTDKLFENVRTKVRPNFRIAKAEKTDEDVRHGRKRRIGNNLSNSESLTLFKCVIICKTINENQIHWPKISEYLNINKSILKTKWPRVRMMIGQSGVKVARRNWKKILLTAVREGKIEMNEIENLDLEELVDLWNGYESGQWGSTNISDDYPESSLFGENKLLVNIEENFKRYKFTKLMEDQNLTKNHYDQNSMIQREQYLINSVFTYDEDGDSHIQILDDEARIENYEEIRNIIVALVAGGSIDTNLDKLQVLEKYDRKEIDTVFMDLVKNRQVVIGLQDSKDDKPPLSKALIGDKISTILEDHSFDFNLRKIPKFQTILKELLESGKGLVLNPLFDNSYMVSILELIFNEALNLTRVDHYRKEVLTGYEARTLEREKLDADIILTILNNDAIKDTPEKLKAPIPRGKPCSHVWIDVEGRINVQIWEKLLKVIVSTLISKPGITESDLIKVLYPVLSEKDTLCLMNWLDDNGAVRKGEFEGYWLQKQWYVSLGF